MLRLQDLRTGACAWAFSVGALAATWPVHAAQNDFATVGPEGGSIYKVSFHPTLPDFAYALTTGG